MQRFSGERLSKHGYWRVGGPMEDFALVESVPELVELYPQIRWILGNGSNLLAPDQGLAGLTVRLALKETEWLPGDRLRAGAGLLNTVLLSRVLRQGLCGLAPLAGVPGTVGGAVAMNAGTALGEIAEVLEAVEGVDARGFRTLSRAELPMHYREGGLPEGFVVTAAIFRLRREGAEEERQKVNHHLQRRMATQPLDMPSCGSVFRNPPGDHAGRLIESVGLKGWRSGGACLSERHANFIVNEGDATATDVMHCIRTAWERVRDQAGVTLVPEVRVLGDWPAELWPLC